MDHTHAGGSFSPHVILVFTRPQTYFPSLCFLFLLAPNHWTVFVQIAGKQPNLVPTSIFLLHHCNTWDLRKLVPSSTKPFRWLSSHQITLTSGETFVLCVIAKNVGLLRTIDETSAYLTLVLWHHARCNMEIAIHYNTTALKKKFDGIVNICSFYLKGILLLLTLLNITNSPRPRYASVF